MTNQKHKQKIHKLLTQEKTGVLATQSSDFPYTSIIAFIASEDLKTIIFATKRRTQKFKNIQFNDKVSLMVDDRKQELSDFSATTTLTLLGYASQVEKEQYKTGFLKSHSQLKEFINHSDCVMMKIEVDSYILVQNFQQVTTIKSKEF